MQTPPAANAGYQVIAMVPATPEYVVVGCRNLNGRDEYVTWLWSPEEGFYWGKYDYSTMNDAVFGMCKRAGIESYHLSV